MEAERARLGEALKQHGISWEKQNTHREHLSVGEYKACAEIVSRKMEQTSITELTVREPNAAMRLAGVKQNEVIISRSFVDAVQQENTALRTQAKIDRKTNSHLKGRYVEVEREKSRLEQSVPAQIKTAVAEATALLYR